MSNKQKVSVILMILGIVIFGVYLWWALNTNLDGLWGAGIWIVACAVFGIGAANFYNDNNN